VITFSVATSDVATTAFVTKHPANRSAAHPIPRWIALLA
jgi:hypothetical protein